MSPVGLQKWIKIETPILKANYLLRSIDIPAGEHTIEFVFKPRKKN